MKILIFILIALLLSFLLIIESNNFNMTKKEDAKLFVDKCGSWAKDIYSNLKDVTGYAVKLEWFPEG